MIPQIHDHLQDPLRPKYLSFRREIEHYLHQTRILEVRVDVGYVMVYIAARRLDDSHFRS